MRKLLLAVSGAALFGLAYGVSPTSAAPTMPVQIAAPDSGIEQAQMTRRRMMNRRMMTRQRMMNRRTMRRGGGVERSSGGSNVSQPSRAVPQTGPGGGSR